MKKFLLIIILFLITGCTKTYDLKNYCYIDIEGYDGAGKVNFNCDLEKLMYDIDSKKYNIFEMAVLLESEIDISIDYPNNLKNGDSIKYYAKASPELQKALKVNIKSYEGDLIVNNLSDLAQKDPFENVDVVFSGISPFVKASIVDKNTGAEIYDSNFNISKKEGITIGETITVTSDGFKDYSNGYEYLEQSRDYVCNDVPVYVDNFNSISNGGLNTLNSIIKDNVYIASSKANIDNYSPGEISYVTSYFLTSKDLSYSNSHNKLIVFYQQPYSKDTAYYEIGLNNIVNYSDNIDTDSLKIYCNSFNTKRFGGSKYPNFDSIVKSMIYDNYSSNYDIEEVYIEVFE